MRHIALPLPSIPELPDDQDRSINDLELPNIKRCSEMMDEEQQQILTSLLNALETRQSAYKRRLGKSKMEAFKYYSQNYRRLEQSKRETLVLKKMEKLLTSQLIVDEIQEQEQSESQFSTDEETYLSQVQIDEQFQQRHYQNDTFISLDQAAPQQKINNPANKSPSNNNPNFSISYFSIIEEMILILLQKLGILNTKSSTQMLHLQLKQSREYLYENRSILQQKLKLFLKTIQSNDFFLAELNNKTLINLVQSFTLKQLGKRQKYNRIQLYQR